MARSNWYRVSLIVDEVLEHPAVDKRGLARQRCQRQPELLDDVLRLLDLALSSGEGRHPRGMAVADEAAPELATASPQRIGPYRIDQEIGSGSMGTVYRAQRVDGPFEQRVAIKLLPRWRCNAVTMERFRLEQQFLASLEHPHIARLYDGGLTEDGQPYIIMEYVPGLPITDYCEDQRLGLGQRLHLVLQVAETLQFAHRNLVIHRDIKPSNLLVQADATIKLLDFGIAKSLSGVDNDLTRTHDGPMTPDYAAPEQLLGQPVSVATDVYQLGLLAYQLLTGQWPFGRRAESLYDLVQLVNHQRPQLPSVALQRVADPERRSGFRVLRGDIDAVLLKALEKKPEDRYTSMAEFVADLQAIRERRPVAARQQTLAYRTSKLVRRHPLRVTAAALLAIVLVGYSGVLMVQHTRLIQALKQATYEASKSQQTVEFLKGIFAASDPDSALGESISARQLLERSKNAIGYEFSESPELRAELQTNLGIAYGQLGLWEPSQQLLEQALDTRESLGDSVPPADLAQTLIALGQYTKASTAEAVGHLNRAIAVLDKNSPGPERVLANIQLGSRYWMVSDYARAVTHYQDAAAEVERRFYRQHPSLLAEAYAGLSSAYLELGELALARDHALRAIDIQKKSKGPVSSALANYQGNLAKIATLQGERDEALALLQSADSIRMQLYGERSGERAISLLDIASFNVSFGNLLEAETVALQARDVLIDAGNPYPTMMGRAYYLLGAIYRKLKRLDEAQANYLRAYESQRTAAQVDPLGLAATLSALARVEHERGNFAQAHAYFDQALQRANQPGLMVARIQVGFAALLLDMQRWTDAEVQAMAAVQAYDSSFEGSGKYLAEARALLAQALFNQVSRRQEGLELANQAWGVLSNEPETNAYRRRVQAMLSVRHD